MNILMLIAMPFYSPLAFLRLYYNKKYFYFFLSSFSTLAYFYCVSTLFNLIDVGFNFLIIFFISFLFDFLLLIKTSIIFSFVSNNFSNLDFKTIVSINVLSLYPYFIFLPLSNLFKGLYGIDFLFLFIPMIHSIFLRKKFFKKITRKNTNFYFLMPLVSLLVVITLMFIILISGLSSFFIFVQLFKSFIL
ncbi:MAG TPA: hypothetical protein PK663_00270 [Spirochaetota bacterium]|nr:hypothetical protein [Spirochaetota bacterium]